MLHGSAKCAAAPTPSTQPGPPGCPASRSRRLQLGGVQTKVHGGGGGAAGPPQAASQTPSTSVAETRIASDRNTSLRRWYDESADAARPPLAGRGRAPLRLRARS